MTTGREMQSNLCINAQQKYMNCNAQITMCTPKYTPLIYTRPPKAGESFTIASREYENLTNQRSLVNPYDMQMVV
eukprot:scaffold140365_cov40-Prasinocladus_malaysianus.AAC.1